MTTEHKLLAFGTWCLQEMRIDDGNDIDGGAAQDKAKELGLLVDVTVTERCGEQCYCAEYYGDFPATCLRYNEEVRKVLAQEQASA